MPPPGETAFDLIVCRNVLIYFDGETVDRVIDGLGARCDRAGTLILGSADVLCGTAAAAPCPLQPIPGPARAHAAPHAAPRADRPPGRRGGRSCPTPRAVSCTRSSSSRAASRSSAAESLRYVLYLDPTFGLAAFALGRATRRPATGGGAPRVRAGAPDRSTRATAARPPARAVRPRRRRDRLPDPARRPPMSSSLTPAILGRGELGLPSVRHDRRRGRLDDDPGDGLLPARARRLRRRHGDARRRRAAARAGDPPAARAARRRDARARRRRGDPAHPRRRGARGHSRRAADRPLGGERGRDRDGRRRERLSHEAVQPAGPAGDRSKG